MRLEELDFDVPERLIAQYPVEPRDSCRLLHLTPHGQRHHRVFSSLPEILRPGDTLVFNDSRVLPARVEGRRVTGGRVELLFLRPGTPPAAARTGAEESWEALVRPSHRMRPGEPVVVNGDEAFVLRSPIRDGCWLVDGHDGLPMVALLEQYGRLPLPPYIKTYPNEPSSYQTVYAAVPGSAAAPTAGLHFTPRLLEELEAAEIRAAYVTLHVGLDTFQPIREPIVERHAIHREAFSVSADALGVIRSTRAAGGRLVAVGTTATRVLETLAVRGVLDEAPSPRPNEAGSPEPLNGTTDIYITPGYRFLAVDALITNFHLPRSTVLALTMAFVGIERLRQAYTEAIELGYRFFSFGDAMLAEERPGDACA